MMQVSPAGASPLLSPTLISRPYALTGTLQTASLLSHALALFPSVVYNSPIPPTTAPLPTVGEPRSRNRQPVDDF